MLRCLVRGITRKPCQPEQGCRQHTCAGTCCYWRITATNLSNTVSEQYPFNFTFWSDWQKQLSSEVPFLYLLLQKHTTYVLHKHTNLLFSQFCRFLHTRSDQLQFCSFSVKFVFQHRIGLLRNILYYSTLMTKQVCQIGENTWIKNPTTSSSGDLLPRSPGWGCLHLFLREEKQQLPKPPQHGCQNLLAQHW